MSGVHGSRTKREFIDRHRGELGFIQAGCAMMELPRSTYYYRPRSRREKLKQDADLRDRIGCFLEIICDQKRLHSVPGCLPPAEFEVLRANPRLCT
ncbi:MAG: hypothetical protein DRG82_15945, partial [Deltaproteobacteria bacterium]